MNKFEVFYKNRKIEFYIKILSFTKTLSIDEYNLVIEKELNYRQQIEKS